MSASSRVCPMCGAVASAEAAECAQCGEDLRAAKEASRGERVLLVVGAVMFVIAAGFFPLLMILWLLR